MNHVVRNARYMTFSWADFFRPDTTSSNRALKKFLLQEGLDLGHRDLVLLKKLSEVGVFLSYAVLECWSEGELGRESLEKLLDNPDKLQDLARESELSFLEPEPGIRLLGIEGELDSTISDPSGSTAMVIVSGEEAGSPLLTVYGGPEFSSQLSMGGAWNEEELQQESVTLLDGESSQDLIEAFRHLFRAAPSGAARASVVGAALSRHRQELNLEVAEKLEEISAPFGQAMRQLFEEAPESGARALQFLLHAELEESPASWATFWAQIRPSILGSLARTERGTDILILSVDALGKVTSGDQFLDHQLLDAFLQRLDELTPSQQERLISLVVEWLAADPEAPEILSSRLELSSGQNQRLLLGECLRRHYSDLDKQDRLSDLTEIFVAEALSAGSTAGSLALAELLRNFGPLVLDRTERDLAKLTERQTLNLIEIWELLLAHDDAFLVRVVKLYLNALDQPSEHLSLLLKSELLQDENVFEAFVGWLSSVEVKQRRQVVQAGYNWSLTVENRERIARALRSVEWDFSLSWSAEWGRPHLSYQRLGWLALCAPKSVEISADLRSQMVELLNQPSSQIYFWDLFKRLAEFEEFDRELSLLAYRSAQANFHKLEAHQDEERTILFALAAACAVNHPELMTDWAEAFRKATVGEVWWLSGVARALYSDSESAPEPSRELVSGLIHRLMSSGERSMKDMLAQALAADEEDDSMSVQEFVPLEVSHLAYETLAAMAEHEDCSLAPTIKRRLVLFLLSWAEQLKETDDPYAFRETPLFKLLLGYLREEDPQLQALLDEVAGVFLELHRKHPDKFRLEVRHAAQQFFLAWAELHPDKREAASWKRVMDF